MIQSESDNFIVKYLKEYEQKHGELTVLEKIFISYVMLGEHFCYKMDYIYTNDSEELWKRMSLKEFDNKIKCNSKNKEEVICTTLAYLYKDILKELGIESEVEGILHFYNVVNVDGKKYNFDLILDLRNIQTKSRLNHFGQHTEQEEWRYQTLRNCSCLDDKVLDELYKKFKYATIISNSTGENRDIYFNDVIKQITEEMQNITPEEMYENLYGEKPNGIKPEELKNKFLYHKIKYIFDFLQVNTMELVECKDFYRKLFYKICSYNELDRVSCANLKKSDGTYSYMFCVEDEDGEVHYFECVKGEKGTKEIDVENDKSLVTVFNSRRRLRNVSMQNVFYSVRLCQ